MPTFRKKPVVIEALRISEATEDEIEAFLGAENRNIKWSMSTATRLVRIVTREGTMTAQPDDWIIRGVSGEFYPCKPDIFAMTYEPAADAPASPAVRDVLAERERQQSVEGWTPEHDDQHGDGAMSYAAACYALAGTGAAKTRTVEMEKLWQWTGWSWLQWWKPKDRRRNLVRAGALILAEIERLDRATSPPAAGRDDHDETRRFDL